MPLPCHFINAPLFPARQAVQMGFGPLNSPLAEYQKRTPTPCSTFRLVRKLETKSLGTATTFRVSVECQCSLRLPFTSDRFLPFLYTSVLSVAFLEFIPPRWHRLESHLAIRSPLYSPSYICHALVPVCIASRPPCSISVIAHPPILPPYL